METHDEAAIAIKDVLSAAEILAHADRATLRHHLHDLFEAHERLTLIVQAAQARNAA